MVNLTTDKDAVLSKRQHTHRAPAGSSTLSQSSTLRPLGLPLPMPMLFTEILLLATESENLEASWLQGFFLKVKPCVMYHGSAKKCINIT